jgi:hypothetical protein
MPKNELVTQSKTVMYLANAAQCEARAQEMPPTLRQDFLVLAENWRKFASKTADAADREGAVRGKADKD